MPCRKKTKLQKEMMVPDVTTEKSGNTAAIDKLQRVLSDAYEINLSDFILFMSVMKREAYEMKYEIDNKKRTTKKRRKKTLKRDTTDISMKSKKRA